MINYAKLYTLRKDGRFMGFYRDESGRRKAIYDRDPKRLYDKIQAKATPQTITFAAVCEEWDQKQTERVEQGDLRPTTFRNYKRFYGLLKGKYGDVDITAINSDLVKATLNRFKSLGYSKTVVNSVRVVFNGIMEIAADRGYIDKNPVESVPLPAKLPKGGRRAPTEEETAILLSHKETPFELYVLMLICCGLRRSEGLALRIEDVDLQNRIIHVRRSLVYVTDWNPIESTPKTEAGIRDVYIPDILLEPLRAYIATRKGSLLFPRRSRSDGRIQEDKFFAETQITRYWNDYRKKYGLPDDLTIHCLRHGTVTILFESGVDVLTTSEMIGHSNVKFTMDTYAELRAKQRRKSMEQYNRALLEQG